MAYICTSDMKINFHFVQVFDGTLAVVHHGVLRDETFIILPRLPIGSKGTLI